MMIQFIEINPVQNVASSRGSSSQLWIFSRWTSPEVPIECAECSWLRIHYEDPSGNRANHCAPGGLRAESSPSLSPFGCERTSKLQISERETTSLKIDLNVSRQQEDNKSGSREFCRNCCLTMAWHIRDFDAVRGVHVIKPGGRWGFLKCMLLKSASITRADSPQVLTE